MTHKHYCLARFHRFLQKCFAYKRHWNGSNECRVRYIGVNEVVEVGHEEKKRCKIDIQLRQASREIAPI